MAKLEACMICGSSPLPKGQRKLCGSRKCELEHARRKAQKYKAKHKGKIWVRKNVRNALNKKECPVCKEEFYPRKQKGRIQIFCNRKCYIEDTRGKPKPRKGRPPKVPLPKREILNPITLECQFCSHQVTIENIYRTKDQGAYTCSDCLEKEKSGKDGELTELMAKRRVRYLQQKAEFLDKKAQIEREKEKRETTNQEVKNHD